MPISLKVHRVWFTGTFYKQCCIISMSASLVFFCTSPVHSATLFLNVLACLACFTIDSNYGVDFGLAILWFILFTPVAFVCWYRPVYKAFRYAVSLVLFTLMNFNTSLQTVNDLQTHFYDFMRL